MCIDEQMVPFKGKLSVKQYMRGKPSPWGIKIFVLASDIYAAGTVRANRFVNPPLLGDKIMAKICRGSTYEIRSHVENACVIGLVKWFDNKSVILGSNFITSVERPEIVKLYNASMGGVDKADQMISLYRTFIKSQKWTIRMIFHAFDLVASNAWLQYKEAEGLRQQKKKVGRPIKLSYSSESPTSSSSSLPLLYSPTNRTDSSLPLDVSRYDRLDHMPKIDCLKNATKCKNPMCSRNNRTHFYCTKCNVHLCLTKERNCFADFHKKN
ncbi:hypothetical protein QTP88_023651 [Uroleucon formosanum]